MSRVSSHLTWLNFQRTVLVPGELRVHRVSERPRIEIFADGPRQRIGLWLESAADEKPPDDLRLLTVVQVATAVRNGRHVIEVATSRPTLQRQFYHFAVAVSERIANDGLSAIEAVMQELQCFSHLFEQTPLLSTERQIGLLGELLFLERLMSRIGSDAVDAWMGPLAEPHDFRVGSREYEIKTTTASHRVHTVHGTEQLVPSLGCSLSVISILVGPPGHGEGTSLSEKAKQLADAVRHHPEKAERFQRNLEGAGLRPSQLEFYSRRFVLRRPLGVVYVDDACPAITRGIIDGALGALAPRIEGISYDVNFDGLAHEDGSPGFEESLPPLSLFSHRDR